MQTVHVHLIQVYQLFVSVYPSEFKVAEFVSDCPIPSLVLASSFGFFLDLISFKVCSMERRSLLCELGTARVK